MNDQFWNEPPQEAKLIYMGFPCIVFDGTIYEAIVKNGKMKLQKTNHIILTRSTRASYSVYDVNFLIDVVTKNYFNNYLRKINNDVKSCFDKVTKHKRRLWRELEKLSMIRSAT